MLIAPSKTKKVKAEGEQTDDGGIGLTQEVIDELKSNDDPLIVLLKGMIAEQLKTNEMLAEIKAKLGI